MSLFHQTVLLNFPLPYPDELFYSLCARYGERTNYPDAKTLALRLFGSRSALAVVDLPNHLEHFFNALPEGYFDSVHGIIDAHTLLPFYRPFLPEQRATQIEEAMRFNGTIHYSTGVMASKVRVPERLRYCPLCAEEDEVGAREPYWRRAHQLPGVEVCHEHKVFLEDSEVKTSNRRSRHTYVTARAATLHKAPIFLSSQNHLHQTLLRIAQGVAWLLEQRILTKGLQTFRTKYSQLLAEKGYATYSGRVRIGGLLSAFKAHYSDAVLERLQCPLPDDQTETWLHRLLRHPKSAHHPVRHLLLMHFLGHSPRTFFSLELAEPFGEGPWPCLNRATKHYGAGTIKQLELHHTKDRGKPVGTFRCPQCRFTYQRTGSDKTEQDRYRIDKMVDFGPQWLHILEELEAANVSLREKARRLGVSSRTVRRYERSQEGLQRGDVSVADVIEPDMVEAKRREWRHLQQEHPRLSVTHLRERSPALYAWLYRNDRAWLQDQGEARRVERKATTRSRVDWNARDREFAGRVPGIAESLQRSGNERPRKVSVAAIARELGCVSLIQQHIGRLPLTSRAIEAQLESREAFALRRIAWATERYRRRNAQPKAWQLVRLAAIRPDLLELPTVQEAVNRAVALLRNGVSRGHKVDA